MTPGTPSSFGFGSVLLWATGSPIGDKYSVLDANEEKKLEVAVNFILNNDGWIQENFSQPLALSFCARLFSTHPPECVKEIMELAKKLILRKIGALELLIGMYPTVYKLFQMHNPHTNCLIKLFHINLFKHSNSENELLQAVFTDNPDYGISFYDITDIENLKRISKVIPQIKALYVPEMITLGPPGRSYNAIPATWRSSIEWLFCTSRSEVELFSWPSLVGVFTLFTPKIVMIGCERIQVIDAPQLAELALFGFTKLPVMPTTIRSIYLSNCSNIETIETNAIKLRCRFLENLKSITAPLAEDVICPESAAVQKLHAPNARRVSLASDESLKDVVLPSDARKHVQSRRK